MGRAGAVRGTTTGRLVRLVGVVGAEVAVRIEAAVGWPLVGTAPPVLVAAWFPWCLGVRVIVAGRPRPAPRPTLVRIEIAGRAAAAALASPRARCVVVLLPRGFESGGSGFRRIVGRVPARADCCGPADCDARPPLPARCRQTNRRPRRRGPVARPASRRRR